MNIFEYASLYLSKGMSVFPLVYEDKRPMVKWKRFQESFPTNEMLIDWFDGKDRINIGCATGNAEGIFVVDCDTEVAVEFTEKSGMPTTVCSQTRRGRHYFLVAPIGYDISCVPQDKIFDKVGIDIKGRGGLVVLPPSVHASGHVYSWINSPADTEFAQCPQWVLDEIDRYQSSKDKKTAKVERPREKKAIVVGAGTTKYGASALKSECDQIASEPSGSRNHRLNKGAFAIATLVAAGYIVEDEAMAALEVAGESAGLDPFEVKKTITSAFESGKHNPRTVESRPSREPVQVINDIGDIFASPKDPEAGEQPSTDAPSKVSMETHSKEAFYVHQIERELPRIKCRKDRWFRDRENYWEEFDKASLLPFVLDRIRTKDRTRALADNVLNQIEGIRQVSTEEVFHSFHMFDPDNEGTILINVKNGLLSVTPSSIEFVKKKHNHTFVARIETEYDAEAKCPTFVKTLIDNTNGIEDIETLTLSAANILYPSACAEACLVLIGKTGTGKSTIAEPIAHMLGQSIVTNVPMSMICDPKSFSIPRLEFSGLNLASELDSIELADSANFKQIVSGEAIEVKPIWKEPYTMRTTCCLWFLANHLPRFKHGSGAEMRRIRFVEFTKKPESVDPSLKSKLSAEAKGILNLVIYQLQKFMVNPVIPVFGASSVIAERFAKSNDPIGWFAENYLVFDHSESILKDDLYSNFRDMCEEEGIAYRPDPGVFFKHFLDKFTSTKSSRQMCGTVRCHFILGVTTKKEKEMSDVSKQNSV